MGDLKLTSASGSVTLSPENVAGTTTITVPSSTATLLTTSLSNLSATGEQKVAQAWVYFTGWNSPLTIEDSYNVSSVTDNGTGDYTVNFSNAMANADYSVALGGMISTNDVTGIISQKGGTDHLTGSHTIYSSNTSGTLVDARCSSIVFGD